MSRSRALASLVACLCLFAALFLTACDTTGVTPTPTPSPSPTASPTPSPTATTAPTASPASSPRAWGQARVIETENDGDAIRPVVCQSGSGMAMAVWQQSNGTQTNIWANHYDPASGWGEAEIIENYSTSGFNPKLAMNASGDAVVVWEQDDGTRTNIAANVFRAGIGWGTAQLIESNDEGMANLPRVAMDDTGNAIAVWQQAIGGNVNAMANRYVAGTGWGTAIALETGTSAATYPDVAISASGNAIAVWQQSDGSYEVIWTNSYTAGTGWGTAVPLETGTAGNSASPQIAMDDLGNAVAAWTQTVDAISHVRAAYRSSLSGWGAATALESYTASAANDPRPGIDNSGNAVVVWSQFRSSVLDGGNDQFNIFYRRYTQANGWGSASSPLESNTVGNARTPDIAINGLGSYAVVWTQNDGTRDNIWAIRFLAGSGWSSPKLIETFNAGSAANPKVSLDNADITVAVWSASDGYRSNIMANVMK